MSGSLLVNVLLKTAFHRHRPSFDDTIPILTTYSFPSGHAMAATVVYGVLTAFLFSSIPRWRWRVLVSLAGVFLIMLVAFSRVYLGVHYLSDVMGGVSAGLAWLALCLTAAETLRGPPAASTKPGAFV